MGWLLFILLATPLLGAGLNDAFADPGGYVIVLTGIAAGCGIIAYLSPFLPKGPLFRAARVAIVVICALMTAHIRFVFDTPAYQPSLFAFAIFLLSLIIMEGYVRVGLAAGLLICASAFVQVILLGSPPEEYLSICYLLVIVILAAIWSSYVTRLIQKGNELDHKAFEQLVARRADALELTQLRLRNALSASGANAVLERVSHTAPPPENFVDEVRLAEASLRDHLSAPIFSHSLLTAEINHARSRNVTVHISGENIGVSPHRTITNQLSAKLVDILRFAHPCDTITIRHIPHSHPPEFNVLHVQTDSVSQFRFNELGRDIP